MAKLTTTVMAAMALVVSTSDAFVVPTSRNHAALPNFQATSPQRLSSSSSSSSIVPKMLNLDDIDDLEESEEESSGGGRRRRRNDSVNLDSTVRTKLISESIAPWRTLRVFLYFAFGSSALLGGLVTLPVVAAGLSGVRTDVDLNAEYVNLAVDFGAVTAFALFAKFDLDKGAELNDKVEQRLQAKKDSKKYIQVLRERESALRNLSLDVCISDDGSVKTATVSDLQKGANQSLILVLGNSEILEDALLATNLLGPDLAKNNVLLVPYMLDGPSNQEEKGFKTPTSDARPFVAKPSGAGWKAFMEPEIADAVRQNGESVKGEGIAIVIDSKGEVLRRGVGEIPWTQLIEEIRISNSS